MTFHESHWRRQAAPIITRVISENQGKTEKEVRAAISAAYPFGMRKYHPYKIWCDEVRKQLGGPARPRHVLDVRHAFLGPRASA